ncbi:MAG: hypothetical protein WCD31_14540 [Gillisia sp.]
MAQLNLRKIQLDLPENGYSREEFTEWLKFNFGLVPQLDPANPLAGKKLKDVISCLGSADLDGRSVYSKK